MEGRVVKFNAVKRFGFVRLRDNGLDYFFHKEDYLGSWEELVNNPKINVECEITESPKGPRVTNVRPIGH